MNLREIRSRKNRAVRRAQGIYYGTSPADDSTGSFFGNHILFHYAEDVSILFILFVGFLSFSLVKCTMGHLLPQDWDWRDSTFPSF